MRPIVVNAKGKRVKTGTCVLPRQHLTVHLLTVLGPVGADKVRQALELAGLRVTGLRTLRHIVVTRN